MPLFDPYLATRRRLQGGLVVAGIVAGAAFSVVLTVFGKIATGAPPADAANYFWNAAVLGVVAGVVSPLVSWSALRRAPLWRTIAEPFALAVVGGAIAVAVAMPPLILALPPIGLVLGFVNLRRRYHEPDTNLRTRRIEPR